MRVFNGLFVNNVVTVDDGIEKYIVIECYKKDGKGYANLRNVNTNEDIEILCSRCKTI